MDSGSGVASVPRFVVPAARYWRLPEGGMDLAEPRVMGILNLTPDSFSDGGELATVDAALARAEAMVEEGAALLDIGGESTRPRASPVVEEEERRRIVPFVRAAAARFDVPLSVDTRNAGVAREALDAGARVVNDVSALAHDPAMASVVAGSGAGLVLMHMRGEPATMGDLARYGDVVDDVRDELARGLERARAAGVEDDRVVVDPGLGFAKTGPHNWEILRRLDAFQGLGRPVMVGPSRKRFLGELLGVDPAGRVVATAAACVMAYLAGARLFRVHDVRPVVQALRVARAVVQEG